jgi:hypothetical protein
MMAMLQMAMAAVMYALSSQTGAVLASRVFALSAEMVLLRVASSAMITTSRQMMAAAMYALSSQDITALASQLFAPLFFAPLRQQILYLGGLATELTAR